MQEWADIRIKFLPTHRGGRKSPASLHGGIYRPHLRVGPEGEYLGVAFISGSEQVPFDKELDATVVLLYCDNNFKYDAIKDNVVFDILEGPHVVGHGRVIKRYITEQDWCSLRKK